MYDELPRTSWIFKYSAQTTVVVSRTFFTQVNSTRAHECLQLIHELAMSGDHHCEQACSVLVPQSMMYGASVLLPLRWCFPDVALDICVVQEVNEAFDELEEGNEEALKTEYDRQVCDVTCCFVCLFRLRLFFTCHQQPQSLSPANNLICVIYVG